MVDDRSRESPSPGPARRRYLSILFSDLSDSTRLGAAMEAEHYAQMLARLRSAYEAVIPRHGGTIVRIQGDGVLAIFGYPETREDDGRRATEAALDLHDHVRSLRFTPPLPGRGALAVHTGIHAGLVLLDAGDLVRGRFELLGNAPNIASRLSDAAERDQILVSEETLGPDSQFFETGERQYLSLKGRTEPIAVHRILGRAAIRTRFEAHSRRGLAAFVGRSPELHLLHDTLRAAMAGEQQYLAVSGPAGVGKTRLIEEFLVHAASLDCQIHRGYCDASLSAEPLQPFLQMARALFALEHGVAQAQAAESVDRVLAEIDPALQPHRADLLRALSVETGEAPLPQRPAPEHTQAALRQLFAGLAARRPLLLFIDDWQWADSASSQVLSAIRGLEGRPIFVLISTRGFGAGGADMTDARILSLAPFSDDEATETIARLLPRADPFVVTEIRRYSGGNPLFIEELCHSVAHEDVVVDLGRSHGGAAWLDVLIESRVARLPPAQAELVRAAAVIGTVIPAWLLEQLTGCGEAHPLVLGLAEHDFVFPGERPGTLRFKHGITRDAVYDTVGLRERTTMHLRIAQALRQNVTASSEDEVYEGLAYHYGAAGEAAETARYAELAGDKAVSASALDRAQRQYRSALAALDLMEPAQFDLARWSSIAQRLALASVFDPSRVGIDVFRRAVALATVHRDAAALARAEYWLGYIHYALGESREAIHHCERGLAAARQIGDDPLAVQIRAVLGQARAAACDYDRAFELLDEAIAVKRKYRTGARPAVGSSYSLACKAYILGDRGLFAQAHDCFDEALDAVRGASHEVEGSVRAWRSCVYLWQGRWEEARRTAEEAHQIAERVKSLYSFAMSRALSGYARWILGQRPESLQAVKDATSWLEAREGTLFMSLNYGWLADGMVTDGQYAQARRFAARGLARVRQSDRVGEAMTYRALARAAAAQRQPAAARRYLDLAMRSARLRGSPHEKAVTELCDAQIALAMDQRHRAAGLLHEAGAAFEAMHMAWHIDATTRLLRAC